MLVDASHSSLLVSDCCNPSKRLKSRQSLIDCEKSSFYKRMPHMISQDLSKTFLTLTNCTHLIYEIFIYSNAF
jgi:hypothetical protein